MADGPADPRAYPVRMEGDYPGEALFLVAARVEEGLSRLGEAVIEFVSPERDLALGDVLGRRVRVVMDATDGRTRVFPGTCVSVEALGFRAGRGHYRAELRPWLWFLARTTDSRVFQDASVPDLLRRILGEHGVSGELDDQLTGAYPARDYVVQYRETDLAFLSRLMEEEGIYWHIAERDGRERMVLADGPSAHEPVPGDPRVPFRERRGGPAPQIDHLFEWRGGEAVTSGKVTLDDFDFLRPRASLRASSAAPKGSHRETGQELYDHPGRHRDAETGERRARVRMEAEAARHATVHGAGDAATLRAGATFELVDHPQPSRNGRFLVTRATHRMRLLAEGGAMEGVAPITPGLAPEGGGEAYRVDLCAVPEATPWRAPLATPWPKVAGVHTAIVTGPKGEEIHTDAHGRVRVQFHWDREGARDEASSCWVRAMMPWTGKGWGMLAVPRIGQEVVVQFEEGDPDRPLVVGMLYNGDTPPPYAVPGEATRSGLVTRSTKEGSADTFHELTFEDRLGEEWVRFQSERDLIQTVKNDAVVTVGLEHQDPGDMTLTVHHDLTETVATGDHAFAVEKGNQSIEVEGNKRETIRGASTLTVTGDVVETIRRGSRTEDVKQGDVTRTLDAGSEATTLRMGDWTLDASLGSIAQTAMQQIKLEVGANSITIDQAGITLKGIMVKIEGQAMLEAKAPMTNVKGDALLILKGGLTMIN